MKPRIGAMQKNDSLPADAAAQQASAMLQQRIVEAIDAAGGWIPFDRYMDLALYAPGLGYYAAAPGVLGAWGGSSDFITAPELSPLFAATLARQIAPVATAEGLERVVEFGAGSGRLARDLLPALQAQGWLPREYAIVEVSAAMAARQREAAAQLPEDLRRRIVWWDALPARFDAVVLGNEVLDAMPVRLLARGAQGWSERGVGRGAGPGQPLRWIDRAGARAPRPTMEQLPEGSVTEVHDAADAFIATLGAHLGKGLALFIDYGFPAREYDHPQRGAGTLRCHRAHRAHDDPLWQPGLSDITAHVDFSGVARAGAQAGLDLLGYTSQARFLLNCGLLDALGAALGALPGANAGAPQDAAGFALAAGMQKLVNESEMGELFKVIALGRGIATPLHGFARGDRRAALAA
jgi:SAM-dependent MidA family methyltransferase